MKPPLKYTLFCLLYEAGDAGIWEYDLYKILRTQYNSRSVAKIRSLLVELRNMNWTDEMDAQLYGEIVLRKFSLKSRHRAFIRYHLRPEELLDELGLNPSSMLNESEESSDG